MKTYFYRRFDFSKSIWNWIFFAFVDFIPFFVFHFGWRSYKNSKILCNHVCLLLYWVCICKARWPRQKFKTEHIVKKIMQLQWPKYLNQKTKIWDERNTFLLGALESTGLWCFMSIPQNKLFFGTKGRWLQQQTLALSF